ncbi:MAG: LON peptidase substrate-binding domain-containing protein [Gammaproteobacteria bacterium]
MAVESGVGPGDFAIPDALPVLPLRDAVVFPLTAVPLGVALPRSVRLVDDVMRGNRLLALVAQRDAKAEPAAQEDLHAVGTAGVIHQLGRVPDGKVRLLVQGIERIRLLEWIGTEPYLVARIEIAGDHTGQAAEVDALRRAVVDIFRRLVEASAELPDELAAAMENITDPRHVVYFVASVVPLEVAVRQELLERDPVTAKLRRLIDLLQREVAVRELGRKITTDTEERLSKKQREFYLREQLQSIQRELGEDAGDDSGATELRRRIEEASLPDEARREAERELGRLAGISPSSPEHGMIRTYLEWMGTLPWSKLGGETIDIHLTSNVVSMATNVLEQAGRRDHRHPPGPAGIGRGPLRPGEDQGPDPRIPGRQEAPAGARRPGGPF